MMQVGGKPAHEPALVEHHDWDSHHHGVRFAAAGDAICEDSAVDAVHGRLHDALRCALIHLVTAELTSFMDSSCLPDE